MLEICVDSVESAINAERGGADRLELCSSLALGGLTPSIGLLKVVKEHVKIPLFCMIRPRHGDFIYSQFELDIMKEDVKNLKENGADGFVFGILTADGSVNKNACEIILKETNPAPITFHRAFDVCSNCKRSLEDIIELGFSRILTSGQAPVALQGLATLQSMIEQAENRITVMIGSGVNESNIEQICKSTKAKEFHGSASVEIKNSSSNISMGSFDESPIRITCEEKVKKMKAILDQTR